MEKPLANPQSVDDSLLAWKGPQRQGAALGFFIEDLGLPPTEGLPNQNFPKGVKGVFAFLRTAENAASKHEVLLNQISKHEVSILDIPKFPKLTTTFRTSIPGNTEGISTLVTNMDNRPVLHTRFMRFDNEGKSYFAITGLQRYTDEELSPVATEMESRLQSKPPLRIAKPQRYKEFQEESLVIDKLEKLVKATLPEIAVATCLALAKACFDNSLLITTYDNQLWVKVHKKDIVPAEIPNVYDSTAEFFGMHRSLKLPTFWELPRSENGIGIPKESESRSNAVINSVAEKAFQSYSTIVG